MLKFKLIVVILCCFTSAFSQKTWNIDGIGQVMTYDQLEMYASHVNSVRKLRLIAKSLERDGMSEKAAMVYKCLVKNFYEKVTIDDVRSLYTALLKCDRYEEIPLDNLQYFSAEAVDLLKMARARKENNDEGDKLDECVTSKNVTDMLAYGYNLDKEGNIYLYSDSLNQIWSYRYENGELVDGKAVEDGYSNNYDVISVQKFGDRTNLYTVFNKKIGLYCIDIVGDELPKFIHNSRYYSTGMPWFDINTNRLYFCSDNKKGYGGWDIYYSQLEKNRWLKPVILDEKVNTSSDDILPYVKDKWIFYSSDGHIGKGKLDNYAFDMLSEINYNLLDYNSTFNDFCIRLVNDSTDFFTCRESKLLRGHYDDFWERIVENEDAEHNLMKEDSLLKMRLDLFVEESKCITRQDSAFVENPKIYNFDESIYFPFGGENLDQSEVEKLDRSVDFFSKMPKAKTILVYGSSDPKGSDGYNDLLSMKRARRIIYYVKKHIRKDFDYKTIVLGSNLYNKDNFKHIDEYRKVFLRVCNFSLPYDIILAVRKDEVISMQDLSKQYNNDLNQLIMLNDLLLTSDMNDVYLVGIQTIHRVYGKETLFSLSSRYSCSIEDLVKINHKTDSDVKIGELLIIPLEEK